MDDGQRSNVNQTARRYRRETLCGLSAVGFEKARSTGRWRRPVSEEPSVGRFLPHLPRQLFTSPPLGNKYLDT